MLLIDPEARLTKITEEINVADGGIMEGVELIRFVVKGEVTRLKVFQHVDTIRPGRIPRLIEGFYNPISKAAFKFPLSSDAEFETWYRSAKDLPNQAWLKVTLRRRDLPDSPLLPGVKYTSDSLRTLDDWPVGGH